MTNKDFQKLLAGYQRQDCTPEEKDYVEKWIGSIQSEEAPFLINFPEKEFQFKEKIPAAIQSGREFSQYKKVLANKRKLRKYWAVAARVIIYRVFFFGKEFFQERGQSLKDRAAKGKFSGRAIQNNRPDSQEVKPEDGSIICLLKEILKALEAACGMKIKYEESKISECVLTAGLKDETFTPGFKPFVI